MWGVGRGNSIQWLRFVQYFESGALILLFLPYPLKKKKQVLAMKAAALTHRPPLQTLPFCAAAPALGGSSGPRARPARPARPSPRPSATPGPPARRPGRANGHQGPSRVCPCLPLPASSRDVTARPRPGASAPWRRLPPRGLRAAGQSVRKTKRGEPRGAAPPRALREQRPSSAGTALGCCCGRASHAGFRPRPACPAAPHLRIPRPSSG